MHAVDRTLSIGERASELMRAYARTASPRCYELWYTYVTGIRPTLNDAVKRLIGTQERLSGDDIDTLYESFLANDRLATQADRSSSGMLMEMQQVLGLIESSLGSTAKYGASLEAIRGDLSSPVETGQMRNVVETLISATREVASSNTNLEHRLIESRGEIEALRHMLDEVRMESLTDTLTGIANRKHFESALTSSVATALADSLPLSLIVIDIDEFKRFNDVYGHLTGDQVLRLVAVAMRENVDAKSTLARFGGEEFAVILPRTDMAIAYASAEKIRRNVLARELLKRSTGESLGKVTISLGVAALRPGDTATSLLERADLCMYRAKRAGRNRTVTDAEPEENVSTAA